MSKRLTFLMVVAFLALAGAATWASFAPQTPADNDPVIARGNCIENCG